MFRPMRRKRQELSREECDAVLRAGTSGVLAVHGDDGYPYAVPLSYVYDGERIWFHCATSGHKLDAILADDKVSFCVVGQDQVVPDKYTTYYKSVIAFGRAHVVDDPDEKLASLRLLGERYNPGQEEALVAEMAKGAAHLHMVRIDIEHLSGKQCIELVPRD